MADPIVSPASSRRGVVLIEHNIREVARALIADYLAWDPIVNDGAAVLEAVDASHRYRLSPWDALIVVAARRGEASVLYSEDLDHGQTFGSVQVLNPFLESES